ncbi:hypothetical protein Ancab_038641 [Ancistrocladus abbreviatus]
MSMLDSFFSKGFKAAKCKTLLKLTIPRIKLLRNRRELQIKQMRKDIAKLLETGQEATARIRVEHIIREENMMAAQEILELFCELIAVRLPIIEAQRECPLDLKEAISSVCFAAPRCADLPELLQVQMLFVSKYGKEFVAAATELMPDCGVNRQLIELLSVRAPLAEKKLKLLKDIAEEHGLDWDPAGSETELLKSHEDLLNGPNQFVSGSKLPLPEEKQEILLSPSVQTSDEYCQSDPGLDPLEFPDVPKVLLRPSADAGSATETVTPLPSAPHPELGQESVTYAGHDESLHCQPSSGPEELFHAVNPESPKSPVHATETKQFVPFISPPSLTSTLFPDREINPSPSLSRTKSNAKVDLQDVLAAAQAAAETAERAAAAARSAASLAQVRISELTKKNDQSIDDSCENPFYTDSSSLSAATERPHLDPQNSIVNFNDDENPQTLNEHSENDKMPYGSNLPPYSAPGLESESSPSGVHVPKEEHPHHQPLRMMSMQDDSYFSYPNLFTSENSKLGLSGHSFTNNSRSSH